MFPREKKTRNIDWTLGLVSQAYRSIYDRKDNPLTYHVPQLFTYLTTICSMATNRYDLKRNYIPFYDTTRSAKAAAAQAIGVTKRNTRNAGKHIQAAQMRKQGKTYQAIADALDCAKSTAHDWVKKGFTILSHQAWVPPVHTALPNGKENRTGKKKSVVVVHFDKENPEFWDEKMQVRDREKVRLWDLGRKAVEDTAKLALSLGF